MTVSSRSGVSSGIGEVLEPMVSDLMTRVIAMEGGDLLSRERINSMANRVNLLEERLSK